MNTCQCGCGQAVNRKWVLGHHLLGHSPGVETREKIAASKRGERNPCWRGGLTVDKDGYLMRRVPDHPAAAARNSYVLEHRLVMEAELGRYLSPEEVVHHINGDKQDNRPENLHLYSSGADHIRHHATCGEPWGWNRRVTA